MSISASLVKELRERTGSGMMECKKALVETNGDIEAAVEALRKSGLAKADKKAGRTAAEGVIKILISESGAEGVIVEINCETDFVAKDANFTNFCDAVSHRILADKPADIEALQALPLNGNVNVLDTQKTLVAKIGENINVRRFLNLSAKGKLASYSHGGRIGVVVDIEGGDEELGRDIAMHIAASRPVCVDEDQVSADLIAKEKEIFVAQAQESGKPADIIEKMVMGRIKKYLKEVTLTGQPFVKNPDLSVEQLLKESNAKVHSFVRLEVGEGIEKKQDNFAEEVMAQVKGG